MSPTLSDGAPDAMPRPQVEVVDQPEEAIRGSGWPRWSLS